MYYCRRGLQWLDEDAWYYGYSIFLPTLTDSRNASDSCSRVTASSRVTPNFRLRASSSRVCSSIVRSTYKKKNGEVKLLWLRECINLIHLIYHSTVFPPCELKVWCRRKLKHPYDSQSSVLFQTASTIEMSHNSAPWSMRLGLEHKL